MTMAAGSSVADVMHGLASLLWVIVGLIALLILRRVITSQSVPLKKLGLSPTSGVTMEFAEAKIDEAVKGGDPETRAAIGVVAKRSIVDRLHRNADLLSRARIVWVDDHPENNTAVIELLRQYGAAVDTPTSNAEALPLMQSSMYDVVVSDVARDNEEPNSELKGIDLAKEVHTRWGQRCVLFTTRFDPATFPGLSDSQRLGLVSDVRETVFGWTNRMDEALHLILDVLER